MVYETVILLYHPLQLSWLNIGWGYVQIQCILCGLQCYVFDGNFHSFLEATDWIFLQLAGRLPAVKAVQGDC